MAKESIDRFFDHNLHVESRTIWIGDSPDGLDANTAQTVVKSIHMLSDNADKPITLYINSFGGCWYNGMAIYDAIKLCPCEVTAYVVGSAMSMGSIILQAADQRLIYPNATVMVHDGTFGHGEDIPQSFQNWAEYSKKIQQKMYRIYAERSGRAVSFWRRKCAADMIMTAHEAKDFGLVDAVYGE